MTQTILRVDSVTKRFVTGNVPWAQRGVEALRGVTLEVGRGETLAVVGESGSGKSTLCRIILGLTAPSSGRISFDGHDFGVLRPGEIRRLRRDIQAVFQDPVSSFNPRSSLGYSLTAPLEVQGIGTRSERKDQVTQAAVRVGIDPGLLDRYPHQVSGGQLQRLAIARALMLGPSLVVLDEPVSSLDVSVQAQVLNLLRRLQRELGLTYVFVTHNLSVVRYIANRVAVMWQGRVVEMATADEVLGNPTNAYTKTLLGSVPRIDYGDS